MRINVEETAELLKNQSSVTILAHAHPDGDTLGSSFALCRALISLGKNAKVVCSDEIPKKYDYLYKDVKMSTNGDFVVAVDVAITNLLGDIKEQYENAIDLCIDHHGTNNDYAKQLLLDAGAPSCAEVMLKVIKAMNVEITKEIADCLFTGITTDTGCFKYASVTSDTYRAAAELIDFGADNGRINRVMFETKSKTYAMLEKLAIEGMKFYNDDRIAIITVTQDMYKKTGSNEQETEALAPLTRQIEGVEVGVTFREKADGTCKASLRTFESVNAAELAKCFGGGGHPQAAACRFEVGVEEATKMLVEKCGDFLK